MRQRYTGQVNALAKETAMQAECWDKSWMPSRYVTAEPSRAPRRSFHCAMGLTEAQIDQPFVGVATCWDGGGNAFCADI
jgi:dihydroxyacid dehydratase/phosphogluconate dehydratase